MSDKIFADVDLTVRVERNPEIMNPRTKRAERFSGLVFTITCQDCEMPNKISLPWNEIKHLLDGGQLPGVQRSTDGWQISAPCRNPEGCDRKNTFLVTDSELEGEASMELSRRQRVLRAGGQVR
jgi:hypothetical protein